ncbi:MAG TPA: DUF2807 domain-containing protein [Caulobacteraceae bacterium]|jgi:hypothetical protein
MTKTLTLIAAASFVLAVACLSGAAALGWNGVHDHHLGWGHNWSINMDDGGHDVRSISHYSTSDSADGSTATREIAWNGTDKLDLDIAADVQFTQAPGPAKLVVTGPKDAVEHVVLDGSHLQYDDDGDYSGKLQVTLSAPNVSRFAINGAGALAIDGYNQDQLAVDVSGSGDVTAKGRTRDLSVDISGDGNVDMSGLTAATAQAQISGSGRAAIAPTDAADVHISGDGEIDLKTHPAKLTSDVSGSGRIIEGDETKPS